MLSLNDIYQKKNKVKQLAEHYHADNLRVFGSVARGDNNENSDLDLLVTFLPRASLLDQVGLSQSLSKLFSCHVDVVSERALNKKISTLIRDEIVPL